jgi:hypothetical protein
MVPPNFGSDAGNLGGTIHSYPKLHYWCPPDPHTALSSRFNLGLSVPTTKVYVLYNELNMYDLPFLEFYE